MRPVIPIKLKHGTSSVNYEVLVDSGADLCIFDSGIGEILGLDITGGKPYNVGGIAGQSAKYYVHTVEMEIGGWYNGLGNLDRYNGLTTPTLSYEKSIHA